MGYRHLVERRAERVLAEHRKRRLLILVLGFSLYTVIGIIAILVFVDNRSIPHPRLTTTARWP